MGYHEKVEHKSKDSSIPKRIIFYRGKILPPSCYIAYLNEPLKTVSPKDSSNKFSNKVRPYSSILSNLF